MEDSLADFAAQDEQVLFLLQLPGFGLVVALTMLAAIGDIRRFPSANQMVGYAGLGTRIHDSGLTHHTGRITKAGRRDLRAALVQAARVAVKFNAKWRAELEKKEARMGYQKAIVAIARKLLVAVWHVLTKRSADRFAEPEKVAAKLTVYAHNLRRERRPDGQTVAEYVGQQLERLGLQVQSFRMGKRTVILPPSSATDPE